MSDHSKLAPLLFDFVPKGRTAQDAALYRIMRHSARVNRQQIYEQAMRMFKDLMLYGKSYLKMEWPK